MPLWGYLLILFVAAMLLLGVLKGLESVKSAKRVNAGNGGVSPGALVPSSQERTPYVLCESVLTRPEREFFNALLIAAAGECHVLSKVRLFDLLELPAGTPNRQSWQNRVQSKHVDFVLCHRISSRPMVAIELDDSSHGRRDRRERDEFVDRVCSQVGLPMLRFPVERSFDHAKVRARIAPLLELAGGRESTAPSPLPSA